MTAIFLEYFNTTRKHIQTCRCSHR